MGIEFDNARDGAFKDFSLVVQRIGSEVLEQVTWLLWELLGGTTSPLLFSQHWCQVHNLCFKMIAECLYSTSEEVHVGHSMYLLV